MCKVLIIPGIKKNKTSLALSFTKLMGEQMTPGNSDGLGYAAIDSQGNLFGERWLHNKDAFTIRPQPKLKKSVADIFGGVATGDVGGISAATYNSFGKVNLSDTAAITLHTRYATSSKGFMNCHPFVEDDTSLIHNGMISNFQDFKLKHSTNDSEAILQAYLSKYGGSNLDNFSDAMLELYGYYVAALFSRDDDGRRILDVAIGNNENIFAMWVDELDTYVITTSYLDVETVCEIMGFNCGVPSKLVNGCVVRINPFTTEIEGALEFTPNPRNKLKKLAKETTKASYKNYPPKLTENKYFDMGGGRYDY